MTKQFTFWCWAKPIGKASQLDCFVECIRPEVHTLDGKRAAELTFDNLQDLQPKRYALILQGWGDGQPMNDGAPPYIRNGKTPLFGAEGDAISELTADEWQVGADRWRTPLFSDGISITYQWSIDYAQALIELLENSDLPYPSAVWLDAEKLPWAGLDGSLIPRVYSAGFDDPRMCDPDLPGMPRHPFESWYYRDNLEWSVNYNEWLAHAGALAVHAASIPLRLLSEDIGNYHMGAVALDWRRPSYRYYRRGVHGLRNMPKLYEYLTPLDEDDVPWIAADGHPKRYLPTYNVLGHILAHGGSQAVLWMSNDQARSEAVWDEAAYTAESYRIR